MALPNHNPNLQPGRWYRTVGEVNGTTAIGPFPAVAPPENANWERDNWRFIPSLFTLIRPHLEQRRTMKVQLKVNFKATRQNIPMAEGFWFSFKWEELSTIAESLTR